MSVELREANYADCEQVGALKTRNGLLVTWSDERWTGLWRENPAMRDHEGFPIGWVLEHDGAVVGYLGNIPLDYFSSGRQWLAAAARGFAVDAEHRGHSLRLAAAFFSQKNVDLLLNTSANEAAGNVFRLFKAQKIPCPDCDTALFWVLDPRACVRAALRKRGLGAGKVSAAAAMLAPAVRLEGALRRRRPRRSREHYDMTVLEPDAVGPEFDEYWQRILLQHPRRLLASRSATSLRWHFGNRAATARRARFVCARKGGRLMGYAVLTREDSPDLGFRRIRIADLVADSENEGVIDSLLLEAFRFALADGGHILELIGFPPRVRARAAAGHAYGRRLPSWQFWYKAIAPGLRESLQQDAAWYVSSYDGDASL